MRSFSVIVTAGFLHWDHGFSYFPFFRCPVGQFCSVWGHGFSSFSFPRCPGGRFSPVGGHGFSYFSFFRCPGGQFSPVGGHGFSYFSFPRCPNNQFSPFGGHGFSCFSFPRCQRIADVYTAYGFASTHRLCITVLQSFTVFSRRQRIHKPEVAASKQKTCTRTVGAGEGASRIRCSRRLRRVLALQYILVRRSQA